MALLVKLFTLSVVTVVVAVFLSYIGLELSFNDIQSLVKNTFSKTEKQVVTSTEVEDDIEIYNVISAPGDKLFTKEELSKYDGGENSPGVYLGVLGRVYDVGSGKQHYGPGGGYSFFSAKDGTKAFMTGQFNEKGLIDDATGLTDGQMLELENWISFYDKTYSYKGKLIGNFYTSEGIPTPALHEAVKGIKVGHVKKKEREEENKRFPPCNSQSKKGEYRRVSCSEKSGGIKRNWAGVPRQYFKSGADKPKCVCVNDRDLNNPLLKPYDNCDLNAISCSLPPL